MTKLNNWELWKPPYQELNFNIFLVFRCELCSGTINTYNRAVNVFEHWR